MARAVTARVLALCVRALHVHKAPARLDPMAVVQSDLRPESLAAADPRGSLRISAQGTLARTGIGSGAIAPQKGN